MVAFHLYPAAILEMRRSAETARTRRVAG